MRQVKCQLGYVINGNGFKELELQKINGDKCIHCKIREKQSIIGCGFNTLVNLRIAKDTDLPAIRNAKKVKIVGYANNGDKTKLSVYFDT
jgi:hypothetical protein